MGSEKHHLQGVLMNRMRMTAVGAETQSLGNSEDTWRVLMPKGCPNKEVGT